LTAKDTQFHRGTFSSFLIENAGTLPIKRPKDHNGQKVDNSIVFEQLIKALEEKGDMIARQNLSFLRFPFSELMLGAKAAYSACSQKGFLGIIQKWLL